MSKASGRIRSAHKKSYDLLGQYDGYFFALGKRKRGDSSSITEQELKASFEESLHDAKPYESEDNIINMSRSMHIDLSLCNAGQENDEMFVIGEDDA